MISINLVSDNAWNTIVMSGLVRLVAIWNCWISYKNGYAGLVALLRLTLLNPLAHLGNVVSLSLFYKYYFGGCSSELAKLAPLPYSRGTSTRHIDSLHGFSVTMPRCYKDVYVNSFFLRSARPWNYLPMECFPLTYDLNGFNSKQISCMFLSSFGSFSCNSMPLSRFSALHRVNLNFKKS